MTDSRYSHVALNRVAFQMLGAGQFHVDITRHNRGWAVASRLLDLGYIEMVDRLRDQTISSINFNVTDLGRMVRAHIDRHDQLHIDFHATER